MIPMSISKEMLKGSTVVLVLSMLERKPMYGYQMIKEIEKESKGLLVSKKEPFIPFFIH